jgi:hypothetical protein
MRYLTWAVIFGILSSGLTASAAASRHGSDFLGIYQYSHGQTVEIVAGDELFAVLDGAKYPLQPSGVDAFTNAAGVDTE